MGPAAAPRWPRGTAADPGRFPCSLLTVRRSRRPTLPRRHRRGYAADIHHGLPDLQVQTCPGVPHLLRGVGCAPHPAQIRQVRAGDSFRGVNAGSSRTPLRLARRTRPIWQSWTVPALSRLLPPSPAPPGSGCRQLRSPRCDGVSGAGLPPPLGQTALSTAHVAVKSNETNVRLCTVLLWFAPSGRVVDPRLLGNLRRHQPAVEAFG